MPVNFAYLLFDSLSGQTGLCSLQNIEGTVHNVLSTPQIMHTGLSIYWMTKP